MKLKKSNLPRRTLILLILIQIEVIIFGALFYQAVSRQIVIVMPVEVPSQRKNL